MEDSICFVQSGGLFSERLHPPPRGRYIRGVELQETGELGRPELFYLSCSLGWAPTYL